MNTGAALVDSYFESTYGYYYLALCHLALGHETEYTEAFEQYNTLSAQSME